MKLLALLALVFVSASTAADDRNTKQDVNSLFAYACNYTEFFYDVNCKNLKAPQVVTSKVVPPIMYGFHWHGEPYVFVSPRLDAFNWNSTVVHETVHYILDQKKAGFNRCQSEEAARRAHRSWEDKDYNDKWRTIYKC